MNLLWSRLGAVLARGCVGLNPAPHSLHLASARHVRKLSYTNCNSSFLADTRSNNVAPLVKPQLLRLLLLLHVTIIMTSLLLLV
jgi:hypothetical protein